MSYFNANKLIKNEYVVSLIVKFMMVFIGMIESALLARYLGPDFRGELSYIYSMASSIFLILTLGIYTAYPFKRKNTLDVKKLINEFMTVSCILVFCYMVICTIIGAVKFRTNKTFVIVLLLILIMIYDKIVSFVYMIEQPNKTNIVTFVANLIQCAYLVLLTLFAPANLMAGIVYYILACLIKMLFFSLKLKFRVDLHLFSIRTFWEYVKFGFFPMIALLLTTLNYRIDIIMLRQFDTITLTQIGIYSIGIGLGEKALLIPDTVKEVLLSRLAKGRGGEEVARVMRICFLSSIFTAVVINVFGAIVINLLYGAEYAGAENITYISVWGTTVMVFFKMVSQYNVVHHRQYLNVVFLMMSIIINVIFNFVLIPQYGIIGAAVSTIIGHVVTSVLFLLYFRKTSGISLGKMIVIQKDDIKAVKNILFNISNQSP